MTVDLQIVPGTAQGDAGGDVHAHADGALVQVGLAVGLAGGQAQHGGHRVPLEHDDAHIRYAADADAVEQVGGAHPVFDQRAVAMAAQGIDAGDNPGDMKLQLLGADHTTGRTPVVALEAVGDHHDAIAAGALGRLDHEVAVGLDNALELTDALLGINDAVHVRHLDAGVQGQLLGADLVVHQRVQAPVVVGQHIVAVALVDAHHATAAQGPPGADSEHQRPPSSVIARKRISSARR